MANKTKSANQDQVSTSSSKSRVSSRLNTSVNQNLIREKEKIDLQGCNDRFANLGLKLREVQNELNNERERHRITEENCEIKLAELSESYEKQTDQLRSKLDLECRNSAKKLMEFEKFKQLVKEKEFENGVLVSDLNQLQKKYSIITKDIEKLNSRVNSLNDENEQLRKLVQNLETEKNAIDKTLKSNLIQTEAEKLRSISLEGKLKALEDKMINQKEYYEREIEELKIRFEEDREDQIEQVINTEVDYIKTDLMMKYRRELEENITRIKQDLEKSHNEEQNRLKDQLNKVISSEKTLKCKLTSTQPLIEKLNNKINEFNRVESTLNSRIAEIEGLLEMEKNEKIEMLEQKDHEIKELEDNLKEKDSENQFVVDTNVHLNEEIRIYRNLLDEHEKTLEMDLNSSPATRTARSASPNGGGAPRRFAQGVRKRKRNVVENVNETTIVNKSIGPIAIDESTDQFIRLINRSPESIHLAGWELRRENDEDGWTFKFNKSIIVQPEETVTIYSVDAEDAVHNPPVAIKLKKNWPIGGVTTLLNQNKEEIAKWQYSLSSKRGRFDADEANKSCCLM